MTDNRFYVPAGQVHIQALTTDPDGPMVSVRGPAWVSGQGSALLIEPDVKAEPPAPRCEYGPHPNGLRCPSCPAAAKRGGGA